MAEFDFDAVVVGAGAVGLACGYALSRRGLTVAVLEQEAAIGQGVSSRNSEVIHGGLYYPTGSLKARLCVQGRRALYAFLDRHNVSYKKCGKLVVAADHHEAEALHALKTKAHANGVTSVVEVDPGFVRDKEPHVHAIAALWSPDTGIVEAEALVKALEVSPIRPVFHHCDLKDAKAIAACFEKIGPVQVLVNNAGNDDRHTLDEVTPEYFEDRMAVNLRHLLFCTKAPIPSAVRGGS